VLRATRNRQEPFKYGSLGGGDLALVSSDGGSGTTTATKERPGSNSTITEAAREWTGVDKTSMVELETFISRHSGVPRRPMRERGKTC
jgi:hypothetical protein